MDLLAGYGSDGGGSDSDSGQALRQPAPTTGAAPAAASRSAAQHHAGAAPASGLFGRLPPPSSSAAGSGSSLFGRLPAPGGGGGGSGSAAAGRRVQFKVPLRPELLAGSDSEEEQPKKRAKPVPQGRSLADFLPAPKHEASLGAGSAKKLDAADSDDDDFYKPARPRASRSRGGGAGGEPDDDIDEAVYAQLGNEDFRVADADEDVAAPDAGAGAVPGPSGYAGSGRDHAGGSAYGAAPPGPAYLQPAPGSYGYAAAPAQQREPHEAAQPAGEGQSEGERLLAEALAAEAQRAQRGGARVGPSLPGVQFKEIRQERLTYMNPAAKEAANATRTAFGNDYEVRLRQEAGPAPDRMHKRKHQISSLYHAAKMKELELLEMRTQGLKTKKETQAKYGW